MKHQVFEYGSLIDVMLSKELPSYPLYRCVCPSFDNSPRRMTDSVIFHNSSPELYFRWLNEIIEWTTHNHPPEEQIVFINAWNEWGEGNHLEPDIRWKREYLEKTRLSVRESR